MVEIYYIKFFYFFLFRYGIQFFKLEFKEKVKQQMIISSYGKFKRFNLVVYGFNCEFNSVFEFLINQI